MRRLFYLVPAIICCFVPHLFGQTVNPNDPYDLNNDGVVNVGDLAIIAHALGQPVSSHPNCDLNDDGVIDILDLQITALKVDTSPPKNMSARLAGLSVSLTWEDGGDDEDLVVERRTNNQENWTEIARIGSRGTFYSDNNVSEGNIYYYRIRTDDQYGNHHISNKASVSTASFAWKLQTSSTVDYLASVHFVDSNTGWAVGGNTVLFTSNGGQTWSQKNVGTGGSFLSQIGFINPNKGWIPLRGQNAYLETTDGGLSWHRVPIPALVIYIHFVNENVGWGVGHKTIIKTTDGGKTWAFLGLPADADGWIDQVEFVDENYGWMRGRTSTFRDLFWRTSDGGQTWQAHTISLSDDFKYISRNVGFNVTGGFFNTWSVRRTTDGGQTWQEILRTNTTLTAIEVVDLANIWVVGEGGAVLHSSDGGQNWVRQTTETEATLEDVFFVDGFNGWEVGELL